MSEPELSPEELELRRLRLEVLALADRALGAEAEAERLRRRLAELTGAAEETPWCLRDAEVARWRARYLEATGGATWRLARLLGAPVRILRRLRRWRLGVR